MKRKWDSMDEQTRKMCIDEIIMRVEEIESEQVGIIAAQDIIDIVAEHLGPSLYNAGVQDAKKAITERLQDIEVDLETLEQR